MSRSYRHTPIVAVTTADSDKQWKTMASRKLRRRAKQSLTSTQEGDQLAGKRWEVVDPYSSEKDGKVFLKNTDRKSLRK